ncbi:MAG: argininosuccinate synthase [Nitrososphaeria archaeon]
MSVGKVVLAYSGGLDTSVMIKWIQEKYSAEVYTLTLDLGQRDDFREIEERARKIGSKEHFFVDAKSEFVERFIFPAIKANGFYEGKYPLSTALGRPLIAEKLVDVAHKVGADAVAHGSTGKGNDQVRFDITVRALDPELKVLAPVRDWGLSRDVELEYAKKWGLPISESRSKYSIDQNLWGRSVESGPLEDPFSEPEDDVYEWVTPPERAPDRPEYLTLTFKEGVPVALDGERRDPVSMIQALNAIAGRNGVGLVDHIEDRLVGIKSREVYEVPAALTVLEAHRDLEKMTLTVHELAVKAELEDVWSRLVYNGLWLEPLRRHIDAFIDSTQRAVSGDVRLKFYKGHLQVVGRRSPNSLYRLEMSTYARESKFNQQLAVGFIELWGMQTITANSVRSRASG